MANKVLLKKSSVASKVPLASDLDYGELALNYADGLLYYKNSSNAIQPIGGAGGSGTVSNISTGTGLTGGPITSTGTISIDTSIVARKSDTHYIGTTSVALNRSSANLALTGISSLTLPGSTSGSVQLIPTATAGSGTIITLPATTGTIVTTGDSATVTNTMLAGSIANSKLSNSSTTIGTTSISLGSSSTTLAGLTSVTSTSFIGALTGNADTVTNGVYTSGSYTDPSWLTINYSKLSGTIPTWNQDTTGNAATVTNGVYTSGSYSDPSWLTISKSKVGLSNVENTALSTWAGTTTITTLGTITTGTWNGSTVDLSHGGTGQTTKTAAFNTLSPLTTKGDLIAHNGTDNVRFGVGGDNLYLASDSTSSTGFSWKSVLTPPVTYTASSLSLTNGVYVSGSVTDTQVLNDGNAYQITDGTATGPAWIITATFTGVSSFNRVVTNIDYTASSGHTIYFQVYNNSTSNWDNIGSYSGASGYSQYALEVLGYSSYISGGTVLARLYHSNTGNAGHSTKLDYFALEQSNQGAQGPRGAIGATGSTGAGIATGGTAGQYLVKASSTNYDTTWASNGVLTIGTGLSGTSYDASSSVTIAIDSTVTTLTSTQTLSNKSLNTFDVKTGSTTVSNNAVIQATVATTSLTPVDTFAVATYRSAKYVVQITQGSNYQVSEIMVIHNGTITTMTEYGMMNTNGVLGTFTTDVNAGNARLLVTMGSATSATINIARTTIVV